MFAAGVVLFFNEPLKNIQNRLALRADIIDTGGGTGDGSEGNPFRVSQRTHLTSTWASQLSNAGTHHYFILVNNIDMAGHTAIAFANSTINGQQQINGEPAFGFTNLPSLVSIFSNVTNQNSVIKNINITGNGNVANNFTGKMENVHHKTGTLTINSSTATANRTQKGGLVNNSADAVFINCSNSADISRSVGAVTEVDGGLVGIATGNLRISGCWNSGKILATGNAEVTGGLVGSINNNAGTDVQIEYSYNKGDISGIRSAGLVGQKDGAGPLVIKESYNDGLVSNSTTTQVVAAGILARLTLGDVTIESCVNTGDVRAGTGGTAAAASGILSWRIGGSCAIKRAYNTGAVKTEISAPLSSSVTVEHSVFHENSYSASAGGGASKSEAELRHPSILNTLGAAYVMGADGLPVLKQFSTVNILFHPNGGRLNGGTQAVISSTLTGSTITSATRPGYEFLGWHTNHTATTPSFPIAGGDLVNGIILESKSYFAVWGLISYKFNTIDTIFDGPESLQRYEIWDVTGTEPFPINTDSVISVGRSFLVRTGLPGVEEDDEYYFYNWTVQRANDTWEGLEGEAYDGEDADRMIKEQRLYITLTEEFIEKFARKNGSNWEINICGTYLDEIPRSISIDTWTAAQQSWGYVNVVGDDGVSYNTFGDRIPYQAAGGSVFFDVTVEAKEYYDFVAFRTRVGGDAWAVIPKNDGSVTKAGKEYTLTVEAEDGLEISIEFAATGCTVTIDTRTITDMRAVREGNVPGEPFDGWAFGAYLDDNAPEKVSLQVGYNSFSGITLVNVPNYRLVNSSVRNYMLYNQKTERYDLFHAIHGNINISNITADFFDNYIDRVDPDDPETWEIVIVALYYERVLLSYGSNDHELGCETIMATDLSGTRHELNDFGYFDIGSRVTIDIHAHEDSRVHSITVTVGDTSTKYGGESSDFDISEFPALLELCEDTEIYVEFIKREYNFSISAWDTGGNAQFAGMLGVAIKNGAAWKTWNGEGLNAEDEIRMSIVGITESIPEFETEWMFLGWFIVSGTEAERIGNAEEIMIELNYGFIGRHLHQKINLAIEARFAKVFTVKIEVVDERGGDFEWEILNEEDGGKAIGNNSFVIGTVLELVLLPDAFFKLVDVGGLGGNDDIDYGELVATITVDSSRIISIAYEAQRQNVSVTNKFSSPKGKIKVNRTDIGIGDNVVITFSADLGYKLSKWEINGTPVKNIPGARVSGDSVSFTVNPAMFEWLSENSFKLNSDVVVELNPIIIIAAVVIVVVAVGLLVGFVFMVRANARQKVAYAQAKERQRVGMAKLGMGDYLKSLKDNG